MAPRDEKSAGNAADAKGARCLHSGVLADHAACAKGFAQKKGPHAPLRPVHYKCDEGTDGRGPLTLPPAHNHGGDNGEQHMACKGCPGDAGEAQKRWLKVGQFDGTAGDVAMIATVVADLTGP